MIKRIENEIIKKIEKEEKPKEIKIENGTILLSVEKEFEILLSLKGKYENLLWNIIKIDFLVNEESSIQNTLFNIEKIKNLLQIRIDQKFSNPFLDIFNILRILFIF
jgi:hypothetical protein